eukprot:gnl/TRDRNA2_/TRDRNA2_134964_c0_seq1.p1 gnl/TRDRNA2_/TRDRNA2_134964_c0~~gnl/TRDRNA2_/TRDRNA2_134964_c0_seq1.p1  ORF type:complete len:538 (+),score=96.50 gnl/TRDRNA2_/TRDRNA2_134964_c0_seq1:68-1615(+)
MLALRNFTRRRLAAGSRALSGTVPSKLFINNEWVDAADGRTFPVENPYTGNIVAECARAAEADVDRAVRAAHAAQWGGTWGQATTGASRAAQLHKMGASLRAGKEEWAELETIDNGKPITESRADVDTCADFFDYCADLAAELDRPEERDAREEGLSARVVREPAGVISAITPWNFPLLQSVAKVAPALAAGCAVVLKPSAAAPFTSLKLGELAIEAGLPPGALNVLCGMGAEVGRPMTVHPLVDRVSYTGSGHVGEGIMKDAATVLRQTTMELGGKGAIILFDDYTDIDAAVDWIMCGIFICAGQVCSATSRLLVHESIKAPVLEALVKKIGMIRAGDPMLDETQLGPMISRSQRDSVVKMIKVGIKDGSKLLVGGTDPPAGCASDGAFVAPTVLDDVPLDSRAWTEEIFGPVLAVRSFQTEEEAIRLTNDSPFGLANAVLSADLARCERVSVALRSGVVWQNCTQPIPVTTPFGGFRESGFGKEFGSEGINEYLQVKSVISAKNVGYSWKWYG